MLLSLNKCIPNVPIIVVMKSVSRVCYIWVMMIVVLATILVATILLYCATAGYHIVTLGWKKYRHRGGFTARQRTSISMFCTRFDHFERKIKPLFPLFEVASFD